MNKLILIPAILMMLSTESEAAAENCEEGASSMMDIYVCLDDRRHEKVQAEYNNLRDKLTERSMLDAAHTLEKSQEAWRNSIGQSCSVLGAIAQPEWNLYTNDLVITCRADKIEERVNELQLLLLALEKGQFDNWIND